MAEFNYKEYFKSIKPKTKLDIYNRFIFSFCSIHTSWKSNVNGYNILKNKYHTDEKELKQLIIKSKLGLITTRTKGILEFTKKYLANPKYYKKRTTETWNGYESRLRNDIYGLGEAKTAFAIELIYPLTARVVCTDVHILRWGKQPSSVSKKIHMKVKQGFLNHCDNHNMQPIEMRWRMWDKVQKQTNPRYWSYILE